MGEALIGFCLGILLMAAWGLYGIYQAAEWEEQAKADQKKYLQLLREIKETGCGKCHLSKPKQPESSLDMG